MGRRCKYIDTDGDTVFGICHGFGFKAWTHSGGASIGSFPPGQESYAVAIIEHESDGTIGQVAVGKVIMLESDEQTLGQRCQQLEQVARELYEELKVYMAEEMVLRGATPKEAADRASFCMAKQRYKLEALGVSLDEQ